MPSHNSRFDNSTPPKYREWPNPYRYCTHCTASAYFWPLQMRWNLTSKPTTKGTRGELDVLETLFREIRWSSLLLPLMDIKVMEWLSICTYVRSVYVSRKPRWLEPSRLRMLLETNMDARKMLLGNRGWHSHHMQMHHSMCALRTFSPVVRQTQISIKNLKSWQVISPGR